MFSLINKVPKWGWFCISIIFLVTSLLMRYEHRKTEERLNNVKSLYQIKNDLAFLTFLKQTPSYIPLAETLEAINLVDDTEDPAEVQKLIEKAKELSDSLNQDMMLLIEFSDDYTTNADPQYMVNYSVMNTKKQDDMFILAFQANIWRVVYTVSYDYWKAKPKQISKETRKTLKLIANQVRLLDETLIALKDTAAQVESMIEFDPKYDEGLKRQLLDELKPHLEKLKKIQDGFVNEKSTVDFKS
jgi:hypothetical protein